MTDWQQWDDVPDELRARVLRIFRMMAHEHVADFVGTEHEPGAVARTKAIALAVEKLEDKRPAHIDSHYQVTEVGE